MSHSCLVLLVTDSSECMQNDDSSLMIMHVDKLHDGRTVCISNATREYASAVFVFVAFPAP